MATKRNRPRYLYDELNKADSLILNIIDDLDNLQDEADERGRKLSIDVWDFTDRLNQCRDELLDMMSESPKKLAL